LNDKTYHGLAGNKLDNAGITRLDKLGVGFKSLTSTTIDLLQELGELASNVGSVTIKDRSITGTDLTRVIENDNLSVERSGFLGRVVLRVGSDVTTADILDGDVLDVETDVVTRSTLLKLLVVHFDRLDFSSNGRGSESDNHAGLDDTVSTRPTGTVPIPPIL
jgi:hypothetical protein